MCSVYFYMVFRVFRLVESPFFLATIQTQFQWRLRPAASARNRGRVSKWVAQCIFQPRIPSHLIWCILHTACYLTGDWPWLQPATWFTKVNSSVKTGELLRCRRLFEARGLEVHWVLPKGRHEVSARRPRWWITDVTILGVKHHNFNGGCIHGAYAQKRYHKVMLIEDISGIIRNTAQAIFASLSHDHKYHLNGLAIGPVMSLSNLLKDLAQKSAQWVPNLHENYGPAGVLAMAEVSGPCALYLAEPELHRAQTRQPDSCCGSKKNIDLRWIYGESMVNLWWIYGESMVNLWQFDGMMVFTVGFFFRTPLDPTWWEAQVAMANCNSFRSVVQFCSRSGNESEIWDVSNTNSSILCQINNVIFWGPGRLKPKSNK